MDEWFVGVERNAGLEGAKLQNGFAICPSLTGLSMSREHHEAVLNQVHR